MDKFLAHILVVDDDEGIRSLVKKYLNENNFLVTTAKNAEDATEKIEIINFDMIILDIMMPGKSGLQFIKDNMNKILTPIILLTAKGTADERVEGLEIGADDYLPKPFEPRELLLRIKNILKKTKDRNFKKVIQFSNIEIDLNKLIIPIFSVASSAFFAVVTKKLFSFRYFFTKDLIPSSSSTTKICAKNLSIYNFF